VRRVPHLLAWCLCLLASQTVLTPFVYSGELVYTKGQVQVFDPENPLTIKGHLAPNSHVEILKFHLSSRKYLVAIDVPGSGPIMGLCRPEDLGKPSPVPDLFKTKLPNPADFVRKKGTGDVHISAIPMVLQKAAYCTPATVEQLMRYFGFRVTQEEFALIVGTTDSGTHYRRFLKEIKEMGKVFSFKVAEIYSSDLDKELASYNEIMASRDLPPIKDVNSFLLQLNRTAYAEMKKNNLEDKEKFFQIIKGMIDKGLPIAWGVTIGILPEPGMRGGISGHSRLIIGYNEKDQKIIFSDPWGRGHEYKRMSLNSAYTMTFSMVSFTPDEESPPQTASAINSSSPSKDPP
jgi:hypothetical protein